MSKLIINVIFYDYNLINLISYRPIIAKNKKRFICFLKSQLIVRFGNIYTYVHILNTYMERAKK